MTKARSVAACCAFLLLAAFDFAALRPAVAQSTSGSSLGTPPTPAVKPPVAKPPTVKPPAAAPKPATASTNQHAKHDVPVVHPPKSTRVHKPAAKPAQAPAAAPQTPAPAPAEAPPPAPEQPGKGSVTGLPLPRFAALRSEEVNLRTGPGTRYPIDWVYHRRDLPVQIEREFEVWRLISDPDGTKGWVHQATLTGRRSFIIRETEQTLRSNPRDDADPVARLKPGVVGRLRGCAADADWCEVLVGDYRGYLRRDQMWGLNPGEAIN